jgi:pyruvate dehydrogenase E2 component (dihydrolipoamide acetyltransferase)
MVPLLGAFIEDTSVANLPRKSALAPVFLLAMSHEFRMPDIGEGLTEAEILKWFVNVGDAVEIDQLLVEVETAKTVVEIPSPFAGTITSINATEGETVEVGAVLFIVDGEETNDVPPEVPTPAEKAPAAAREVTPDSRHSLPRAMPIIRKLAKERGIDLSTVVGTGPDGAVRRDDLDTPSAPNDPTDVTPLSQTRQAIADHMTRSWTTIPHVTVQAEVRAEALMAARGTLPLEVVVAQTVMPLLRTYPEFNAEYRDGGIAKKPNIHMGFAVDTDAGLMVVVVRDADQLPATELATEFERLAVAANDRTVTLDDITGQTFTISNIGALGGGHGTPIIPLGTSSIMSIGRATQQPVVEDGELAVGLVAPVDLSYDHRLIDGSLGQRFLSDLVRGLESAESLQSE